jgi:hypothetical protein
VVVNNDITSHNLTITKRVLVKYMK